MGKIFLDEINFHSRLEVYVQAFSAWFICISMLFQYVKSSKQHGYSKPSTSNIIMMERIVITRSPANKRSNKKH